MLNYDEAIRTALDNYDRSASRTMQSREGILGPSDIGFCRQKAVLVTRQVPPTDEVSHWAANVGTAIHNYVEAALKATHPDWLMGSIDNITVTAELPSGAKISGHPDIVIPHENTVLDIKTVDGFEWVKRNGTSDAHKYQRHLYALGCRQADIFDPTLPIHVGNVYFDRSGKEKDFLIVMDEYDPSLTAEIDSWVQDVIYAVRHGEDSARDVAAAVCQRICEFFTVCRGGLAVNDGGDVITDEYLLSAIDMYVQGREQENQGKRMKSEAKELLQGVNGASATHQVRWVTVNPAQVAAFERPASTRLDVVKLKKTS
jgi:hypothetical protein